MWGALEAGREGVNVGVLPPGGTVGLGLVACRLVSLPSLEMHARQTDEDLEFRQPLDRTTSRCWPPFIQKVNCGEQHVTKVWCRRPVPKQGSVGCRQGSLELSRVGPCFLGHGRLFIGTLK